MAHFRPAAWSLVAAILIAAASSAAHAQEAAKKPYTVEYDIRDLAQKKGVAVTVGLPGMPSRVLDWRRLGPAQKAALLAQEIHANLDPRGRALESVEIVNGAKLVIHAMPARHAEIADFLKAIRRSADVAIIMKADLFEVDDAFYTQLKNAKPIDWDELERRFLGLAKEKPAKGKSLLDRLDGQKPVSSSDKIKADNGEEVPILSRHRLASFLPTPRQLYQGQTHRQTVPEGVAITAEVGVSSDRRYVYMRLREHSTEVTEVRKRQVLVTKMGEPVDAEIPLLKETTHSRERDIADGGTILIPVHYRPASLREKNRWWVLRIVARIRIEEEEAAIRKGLLEPAK